MFKPFATAANPEKIVLVGNTAMQLIFSGCDVTPLATYPFFSEELGMKRFESQELGWDFQVENSIEFYPDAIAILRKLDKIGLFGEINSGEDHIKLTEEITLTNKDINEFQLAKAAIAAGLTILANNLSIALDDIHEIYIAGGFGNYINLTHVTETGMIELPQERIRKMGNTALIGAKIFLFANSTLHEEILAKTKHINLEGDPNFQDIYVDKMLK